MTPNPTPSWVSGERCEIGENPLWDPASSTLYWIDISGPAVFRRSAGIVQRVACPKPVGSIYLARGTRLLVALRGALAWLDWSTEALRLLDIRPPTSEERFNDGRCDRDGRLWISTIDRKVSRDLGSIVQFDSSLAIAGITPALAKIGNGICFSPDEEFLYFSDSRSRRIYRYPKGSDGTLGPRTLFAELDDDPGRPDGCTVDSEGCLWSARVGGGRIDRYSPDGRLIGFLKLPVSHPTHCTFGGPDLKTLYVTSGKFEHEPVEGYDPALNGAVLAYELDVRGMPEHRFPAPE
ncbi:SMP-30/gluconolactonase/LRE family protein [Bordetella petrii]|nr:SMP-30/gluconolactonase/LRE family protein [Bordetella petrii]